jgi:DNA polymerase alpha subunit B
LEDSNGHVVNLDLSSVDEYDLFPGQVAVVEGKNEMGKCLRVSKIHFPKPPPFKELKIERKRGTLNILIAAGPFTPSDSLQYEPLKDLISVITKTEPDICILIGPFIESNHKIIQEGIAETFNDLFEKQMEFLKNAISNCSTKVLIVPSYKDVHGEFVYPTPPLSMQP